MIIWLTIVGVLAGSTSVVAVDWTTSRADSYAQEANTSRSRMLIDAESMNTVPRLIGPRVDGPAVSDGEYAIPLLPEVPAQQEPAPATTEVPAPKPKKPAPVASPPVTEPPATEPPTTEPPVAEPPATDPPATDPPAADDPPVQPQPVPVVDPVAEPDEDDAADTKSERDREKAEKKAEKAEKKAEKAAEKERKKAERERRKAERKAKKGAESD